MDRLLDLIADDPYANSAPSQLGRRRLKTRAPRDAVDAADDVDTDR